MALKLLVAEDNLINQKLILRMLRTFGYEADVAENGVKAVEMVLQHRYPVILMDIQMPEMDGIEATRSIRSRLPAESQPKIIAVTANAVLGDRERFLAAGMDDYIAKPIMIEEFRRVVEHWLRYVEAREQTEDAPMTDMVPSDLQMRLTELERETDTAFLLEMIDMYLGDAPLQLDRLRIGLQNGDAKAVMVASHTLKGSSLNIGAGDFAAQCRLVEDASRKGDLEDAAGHAAPLTDLFERLRRQLALFKRSKE